MKRCVDVMTMKTMKAGKTNIKITNFKISSCVTFISYVLFIDDSVIILVKENTYGFNVIH